MSKLLLIFLAVTSLNLFAQVDQVTVARCEVTDNFNDIREVTLRQRRESDNNNILYPRGKKGLDVTQQIEIVILGIDKFLETKSNFVRGNSNANKREIQSVFFSSDRTVNGILHTKANDGSKKNFEARLTLLRPELDTAIDELPLKCVNVLNI